MTGAGIYAEIYTIMKVLLAIAGLFAGFRIYQDFNAGENVEKAIIRWVFGLMIASGLLVAVNTYIFTSGSSFINGKDPAAWVLKREAPELYQAVLYLGILIAVIGLIKVYLKFRNGDDDVYDFMFRWFGSFMFLFLIGFIIDSILS